VAERLNFDERQAPDELHRASLAPAEAQAPVSDFAPTSSPESLPASGPSRAPAARPARTLAKEGSS
jgi:hypothetical protein